MNLAHDWEHDWEHEPPDEAPAAPPALRVRTPIHVTAADQANARRMRRNYWPLAADRAVAWSLACPVALALARATRQTWMTCGRFADIPQSRGRAGHVLVRFSPDVTAWLARWEATHLCETPLPDLRFEINYDNDLRPREQLTPWSLQDSE
jgi:hypothetical protein